MFLWFVAVSSKRIVRRFYFVCCRQRWYPVPVHLHTSCTGISAPDRTGKEKNPQAFQLQETSTGCPGGSPQQKNRHEKRSDASTMRGWFSFAVYPREKKIAVRMQDRLKKKRLRSVHVLRCRLQAEMELKQPFWCRCWPVPDKHPVIVNVCRK